MNARGFFRKSSSEPPASVQAVEFAKSDHVLQKGREAFGEDKRVNQDYVIRDDAFDGDKQLYGVFDGHGPFGHKVSQYVCEILPGVLTQCLTSSTSPEQALKQAVSKVARSCTEVDTKKVDSRISGTTACFSLRVGDKLYTANVGDSKCILCKRSRRGQSVVPLSVEHKPGAPAEKLRIEKAGATVKGDEEDGYTIHTPIIRELGKSIRYRCSRSIGDDFAHRYGVSSEPEIMVQTLHPATDYFCLWASDGLWDMFENDDVRSGLAARTGSSGKVTELGFRLKRFLDKLLREWDENDEDGYRDDISIVVAEFAKPSADAPKTKKTMRPRKPAPPLDPGGVNVAQRTVKKPVEDPGLQQFLRKLISVGFFQGYTEGTPKYEERKAKAVDSFRKQVQRQMKQQETPKLTNAPSGGGSAPGAMYPDGALIEVDDLVTVGPAWKGRRDNKYAAGDSKVGRVIAVDEDKNGKSVPGKIVVRWDNKRPTTCTAKKANFQVSKLTPHLNIRSASKTLLALMDSSEIESLLPVKALSKSPARTQDQGKKSLRANRQMPSSNTGSGFAIG